MITFESVGKTYRNGTSAVVDLSMTAPAGQITVIVGPPGSGKSTALRMVNRLIEATRGRITWDGKPVRSMRRTALRRQLGYVDQQGGLFPHRTVLENIATVPGLLGWSTTRTQQRSHELMEAAGLDRALGHRYPGQLSADQQRWVGLARALAGDPAVLLLDEPFSSVDPAVRDKLTKFFLGQHRDRRTTVILLTSDVEEALRLGDQVAVLRSGGRLAQVGTPQQLLDGPVDSFVDGYLGRDRGYRSLQFLPAGNLALDRVKLVRDLTVAGPEPTLVVDGDARPLSWADPAHPGQVFPLGSSFIPGSDTLRVALDAALTSPVGLAVAVEENTGRYAGVVTAGTILGQIATARAAAESMPVSGAEARSQTPEHQVGPEVEPAPAQPEPWDEESEATAVRVLVDSDSSGVRR